MSLACVLWIGANIFNTPTLMLSQISDYRSYSGPALHAVEIQRLSQRIASVKLIAVATVMCLCKVESKVQRWRKGRSIKTGIKKGSVLTSTIHKQDSKLTEQYADQWIGRKMQRTSVLEKTKGKKYICSEILTNDCSRFSKLIVLDDRSTIIYRTYVSSYLTSIRILAHCLTYILKHFQREQHRPIWQ